MDISKWNKAMESFQELLGWEKGMDTVIDIKRTACGKKCILDIEGKDERRLLHRLRRTYDRVRASKESIQGWEENG
jgi:hypothetical protein